MVLFIKGPNTNENVQKCYHYLVKLYLKEKNKKGRKGQIEPPLKPFLLLQPKS
jgi:hypothetical protein